MNYKLLLLNFISLNLLIQSISSLNNCPVYILISLLCLNTFSSKQLTIGNFYQGYVKIHPNLQYVGSCLCAYVLITKKINHKIIIYYLSVVVIFSFVLGCL